MALDSALRWQLIRDTIVRKKTGVLVVQSGTQYLNWIVEEGNLICVSSTFPEASLTRLVEEKQLTKSTNFPDAQTQVDHLRPIGTLLLKQERLGEKEFQQLLMEHWIACTKYLFDPAAHVFWSANRPALKAELIRADRPLGEVILKAGKNAIPIPTALRTVQQQLKPPFRIDLRNPDVSGFNEEERRIWMYLQSGSGLKQMLQDREIARIPCYKFVFLLWLSGYISDSRKVTVAQEVIAKKTVSNFLQRIPPEWVYPLCAGALIGVILAPSAPEPPKAEPLNQVTPLNESLQKPAWSRDNEKDFNAKTQRREDD